VGLAMEHDPKLRTYDRFWKVERTASGNNLIFEGDRWCLVFQLLRPPGTQVEAGSAVATRGDH
jgi:hypothetical protein